MEIGTGAAPLAKMLEAGASVSLGDDGFIRALDPFVNLSSTFLLHSLLTPGIISAKEIFELHTTRAADALHLNAGAIAPGKLADLVMVENNSATPLLPENVIYHLVLGASASDVCHVIVDGSLVVENGEIKTVDEEAVRTRAFRTTSRLWAEAK